MFKHYLLFMFKEYLLFIIYKERNEVRISPSKREKPSVERKKRLSRGLVSLPRGKLIRFYQRGLIPLIKDCLKNIYYLCLKNFYHLKIPTVHLHEITGNTIVIYDFMTF